MKKFLSILLAAAVIFCQVSQAEQKAFAAEVPGAGLIGAAPVEAALVGAAHMGLEEYMAMVKDGNFALKSNLRTVEAAYYGVLASVAPYRTHAAVSGTGSYVTDQVGASGMHNRNAAAFTASVGLTQRIDISGVSTLDEKQQVLGYETRRAEFDGYVNGLMSEAEKIYWSAVLARENAALQNDVLRQRRENNRITEEKYRQQLVPRLDIIRSEAQVVDAEALVTEAEAQYRNILSSMAALTGGTEVVPAEDPLLVPEFNVSASFEKALSYRPDIRAANLALERAKIVKKLTARGMSPTLDASVNWVGWDDPYSAGGGDTGEFEASLRLNIPILDGNATKYGVLNTDMLVQAAEAAVHMAENTTRSELTVAVNNWEMAAALEQAKKLQVERSDEELRITELMYNEGMGAQIDLINAQTDNQQVRTDYLNSIQGMYAALVELRRAVGDYAPNEDGTWREAVMKYGRGQKVNGLR